MKKVELDIANIHTVRALHVYLAYKLNLPTYYGGNLDALYDALGDVAAAELLGGGEIPLPGLGKLKSKDIAARHGRNPRTGETLDIPAHKAVTFTACKDLKEAMKP